MLVKNRLFVIAFVSFNSIFSQSNSLVIFSSTGTPFYLTINQIQINQIAQSNVKAFNIVPGWQHMEIKLLNNSNETAQLLKDSILVVNIPKYINKEFTYVLIENAGKMKLEFKSVSELSGPSNPDIPKNTKENFSK